MKKIVLAIIAAVIAASPSVAAEKIVLAVMDFEAHDVPRSDAIKASELIRTELINIGEFILVERAQMDKILIMREQRTPAAGCTDVSCAVQVGKLLSARKILVGSVMKIGDSITIAGRVIDVQKGINEFGEKVTVASKNEMVSGIEQFCKKLAARMTGKPAKKNEESNKATVKYYTYTYSSYDGVRDPTGWISLGSFIAGGLICAGGGIYYQMKTFGLKSQIDGTKFMMLGTLGSFVPAWPIAFYIDLQNLYKTLHDAENTRNTIFYVGAGFGGFAALMFVIFISRYIHNTVAVNSPPEPGYVAIYLPGLSAERPDGRIGDQNFKFGLSAYW